MTSRIEKILSFLVEKHFDAMLVTAGVNVGYLSGFAFPDATLLLIPGKDNFIITDPRFIQEANSLKDFKAEISSEELPKVLAHKFKQLCLKKIAFESNGLSYKQYLTLKEACPDINWFATDDLIEKMRSIKDRTELNKIKRAIGIAKVTFEKLLKELRPGLTEKMIANRLEYLLREKGASRSAFETIVASGKNSSRPHARVTQRKWRAQDLLLIDWGVNFEGYNSDLTRMVFSDRISPEKKRIYKILCEVQKRAISTIKPGIKAKELDQLAHKFLEKYKLDKFFLHGLGHGVGREVHEAPWISSKSTQVLEENMVFTVEPAVYFPQDGGMRIEDMVVVTKNGCEVLSQNVWRLPV